MTPVMSQVALRSRYGGFGGAVRSGMQMARRWAPAAMQVARGARRFLKTSQSSRSSPSSSVPSAVTFQHDARLSYRRKRAPRRVRRRAAKSYKRFVKNESKSLGLISRVMPNVFSPATITPTTFADSQTVYTTGLFGGISGSVSWGDMFAIANAEALATKAGKLFFRSAQIDMQVRNSSTTNVLVADIYTVAARKEGYNEPGEDWLQGMLNNGVAAGTTASTPTTLGVTPFDCPGFCSSWVILSKTTYRLSPGNSVYLNLKGRRSFVFETERFEYDTTNTAYRTRMFRGLTKGFVCVFRNADPVSTTAMGPIDYEIVTTKSYRYGLNAYAEDLSGFS